MPSGAAIYVPLCSNRKNQQTVIDFLFLFFFLFTAKYIVNFSIVLGVILGRIRDESILISVFARH